MLKTPPKPHTPPSGKDLRDGDFYAVIGDRMLIAHPVSPADEDGSITMDLYRNLDDYRDGHVMERAFTGRL